MKNILSHIGGVTIIILVIYFAIITPVRNFADLKAENHKLKRELKEAHEETDKVYKQFDAALRYHLHSDKVEEIYSDTKFFQKVDTEISVNPNTYSLNSYSR